MQGQPGTLFIFMFYCSRILWSSKTENFDITFWVMLKPALLYFLATWGQCCKHIYTSPNNVDMVNVLTKTVAYLYVYTKQH